ncbi:MAG: endolytic transglycosylase MltG [Erysipelotrichales bacterium]
MSKRRGKLIALLVVLIIAVSGVFVVNTQMQPVEKGNTQKISFSVAEGETAYDILVNLEKNELIKSTFAGKLYLKIATVGDFKPGVFELNKGMDLHAVIATLTSDKKQGGISITFREGLRVKDYAKIAAKELKINEKEFLKLCNDQAFIDELKKEYVVIKDFDFNPKEIYQLEGLLAPDTYQFNSNTSAKELIKTLVFQTNELYKAKNDLFKQTNLSTNQVYTLASMLETEAKIYPDRVKVASIFMNRINKKMKLGSDVTTYYGLQLDMGARELTVKELNQKNGYNTRADMIGLPVGPINSPSNQSILAALNYTVTDDLYFVSDINGTIYTAKTYAQHNKIIEKLKKDDLWYKY